MAEEQVPPARQRKKRKWDQPAEAVVTSAMSMPTIPGLMQFGGANPLAGFGMPNMFAMMGNYMGLPMTPMQYSGASAMAPNSVAAAAIVQKINQDLVAKGLMQPTKVHDEVISREIVINDADPGVRYKLTKRQTQEEIQAKTGAVVITRGRFRPPNGPPDSEKPLYLHISAGVQLKDTSERIKAVDSATALVEEMMKQGPPSATTVQGGGGGQAASVAVNVGIEADPLFNLVGRIRGPNDQYINHIMNETGAEVVIRGRGSGHHDPSSGEDLQQPVHLVISSDKTKSLDDARRLVENLLETIRADCYSYRPAPYQPLANGPPPSYNLGGVPPHVSSSMRGPYPYQQPNNVYPMQVGAQNSGLQFRPTQFPSGPQAWSAGAPSSNPGPLPQPGVSGRNHMDPYANMRPLVKTYGAVPPPQQLLVDGSIDAAIRSGVSTSESEAKAGMEDSKEPIMTPSSSDTPVSFVVAASSPAQVPGLFTPGLPQPVVDASYRPPHLPPSYQTPGGVPYPIPTYPGHAPAPTYGGYGGVYPQNSPLQQVASALQKPPPPLSVKPGSGVAGYVPPGTEAHVSVNNSGYSSWPSEKPSTGPSQKERRKFQEFPVAAKPVARDASQLNQGAEVTKKITIAEASQKSSMPPPPPKFTSPPPPRSMPRALPKSPPPPSQAATDQSGQDGLKLVEYGEEDEEEATLQDNAKSELPAQTSYSNGKPFWAAP